MFVNHSPMRRVAAFLLLCLLTLLAILPALADEGGNGKSANSTRGPGVPYQDISSAGPLTNVFLGEDASVQIAYAGDTAYQFYPSSAIPGDGGSFVVVDDTLYAPDFANHDQTATGSLGSYTPFTSVSQTSVTGSGTAADPYQVVTVVDVDTTGLRLTHTDTYLVGEESYLTEIDISNSGGSAQNIILYRAADCYLGGSDDGYGYVDAFGGVACSKTAHNSPPDRIVQFLPITAGSTYYEAGYDQVWSWIGSHLPFPDTCRCEEQIDNGAGISWQLTIPASGQSTISHLTTFSPAGNLPLTMSKSADSDTSAPSETNGYTIVIDNPNLAAVTLDSVIDELPSGFSYIEGSTSGDITDDPIISGQQALTRGEATATPTMIATMSPTATPTTPPSDGQTLTWGGPIEVPAESSIVIHFEVTVSSISGTYFNNASAEADGFSVAPTGDTAPITVSESGGISPVVTEFGAISLSVDGLGTTDSQGIIQVEKPAGATVRSAYLAAATRGFTSATLSDGDIQIEGTDVTWTFTDLANSIESYNYWSDVTSIVSPIIDAAPAGRVDIEITEVNNTANVDGEILAVIFDDPNQTSENSVILLFGAQNVNGDTFAIGLAEPIDLGNPDLVLDLGLGISFGLQGNEQYSQVDVNGTRLTTSSGGQDDGESTNGALITVGGLDDSNENPPDPFALPNHDFRIDDELYNLIPFVSDGDTTIDVFTLNPSDDDNIFFASLFLGGATGVVGEGIVLAPSSGNSCLAEEHTVTAIVQDDDGNPLVEREVTFEVISGPLAGTMGNADTDQNGQATFTYSGTAPGTDTIRASFVDAQGNTITSNPVTVEWEDCTTPTNTPTPTPTIIATNTPTATTTPTSSCPANTADLSIEKSDSSDPAMVAEELTYTITVDNPCSTTALNTTVFDALPASVEFVSASASQGTCSEGSPFRGGGGGANGEVTCELGSLAGNSSATITIIVQPTTTGSITNVANVASATTDNNLDNNTIAEETNIIDEGIHIDAVSPNYGLNDVPTQIYIYGYGFIDPLTVNLGDESLYVLYSDPNFITALVPAGLEASLYDVTVNAGAESDTLEDGYEVLGADAVDDLLSSPDWLWTDPSPMRVGYTNSSVGLLVQYLGGRNTMDEVSVEFRLDSATGELLGSGLTNLLAPFAIESTGLVTWEPQEDGEHTICAIIDPDDQVLETNEDNNIICRTITVLPFVQDTVPPVVGDFIIDDDAPATDEQAVTLDVTATDYPILGASGVSNIKFIEFEYILGAHKWVRVEGSDWIPYDLAHQNYPWSLVPTFGMRYMQAWAADDERNISLEPGVDVIDLLPSEQVAFVAQHGVVFYRIYVEAGQTLAVTLTPVSGDPDLYVWTPTGELHYPANFVGVETVAFEAQETATYQIEVHGYSNAEYSLTFNATAAHAALSRTGECTNDRPADRCPSDPAVPLNSFPEFRAIDPPPATEATIYSLYLPTIIR